MPLVVISGLPCSGKSTRAKEVVAALQAKCPDKTIVLLSEHEFGFTASSTPLSVVAEKNVRSALLAATERALSASTTIVVDASHEIKGWRYQMYCLARAMSTPHAVLRASPASHVCKAWNAARAATAPGLSYDEQTMDQCMARYEAPDDANRWDAPLFVVAPTDPLPLQDLYAALYEKMAAAPHLATQPKQTSDAGYIVQLDRVTNSVLSHIQACQANGSTTIFAPGWPKKLTLTRTLSIPESQRLRRQFVQASKLKPPLQGEALVLSVFIDYLDAALH